MSPVGSIFSRFDRVILSTAQGDILDIKNNFISRLGFKILGIPHVGFRLRARKILKNIPKNINNMLDAGCGSGVYSFILKDKVNMINAVDISKEKISYLKDINPFNNIKFEVGDINSLNFSDNKFDFIVCSDVLEHVNSDSKAFSELARVLKPGGTLLLTIPYDSEYNSTVFKEYYHKTAGYSIKDVEDLCLKNNLNIIKSEKYYGCLTEKLYRLNYNLINNKVLLALTFYPLYLFAILSELFFKHWKSNGLFFIITKSL